MKTALNSTFTLVFVMFGLLSYNFLGAWTAPSSNPPNNNTAAPINTSSTGQTKSGSFVASNLGTTGNIFSSNYGPRLELQDVNGLRYWLYNNGNIFYVLADRNNDGSWSGENPWPMALYSGASASSDYAAFSNQVRAASFCTSSGGSCTAANEILNTGSTAQTKNGALTVTDLRANQYSSGNNEASMTIDRRRYLLGRGTEGQSALRIGAAGGSGEIWANRICDTNGGNCTDVSSVGTEVPTTQGIGSIVFAAIRPGAPVSSSNPLKYGETIAGSWLCPAGLTLSDTNDNDKISQIQSTDSSVCEIRLSGTYRMLGYAFEAGTTITSRGNRSSVSLFQKIAN